MNNNYFDSSFLSILKKLKIMTTSRFKGNRAGGRKTFASGSSIEFSDYRSYAPGDDLRFVDWNLFARLDELFIKVFHNEENTNIFVFLDVSKSMQFGDPLKIEFAKKTAAAIAYIALTQNDSVQIVCYSNEIKLISKPFFKTGDILEIFDLLNSINCSGEDRLDLVAKDFFIKNKKKGVAFIISDMWNLASLNTGLKHFKFGKFDVSLFHILDNSEIIFDNYGDWELEDSETNEILKIDIDEKISAEFRNKVQNHLTALEKLCGSLSFYYQRTFTTAPFEYLIMQYFSKKK